MPVVAAPVASSWAVQQRRRTRAALGLAYSNQNAVNSNAPVNVAGHDVNERGPRAPPIETANSSAFTTNVSNSAV